MRMSTMLIFRPVARNHHKLLFIRSNIDGDADTTDTYTFSVLDYGLSLTPEEWVKSAPAFDTVWYDFQLTNTGAYSDQYDLALSGNIWESNIFDAAQTAEISTTPTMAADDVFDFYVRVVYPVPWKANMIRLI